MSVARNVVFNPFLAPGGGATEMAISVRLQQKAKTMQGVESWPYRAVADALEVIPRTLIQNAGGNAIRVLTELRVRPCLNPSIPGVVLRQLLCHLVMVFWDLKGPHIYQILLDNGIQY